MVLASAAGASAEAAAGQGIVPLDEIWGQIIALSWLQAVIAVSFGAVYLFYGWRIFKILVIICFALVGMFAGMKIGAQYNNMEIWGGVAGLVLMGAVAVPLMRWAVSILGAIAGGTLTAAIWYAFELPEKYILAGAIIGIIAGGMISFIVFRIAVMLFTSMGGSALIVSGMLALLYRYESIQTPPTERIKDLFYNQNWFLPVLLLMPTVAGIIIQNKFIKGSRDWSV